jgi:transcriptional regulator with XRE-family HTH domain
LEVRSEQKEDNLVKKTCKELGITQKELAEKIGISDRTVSNWANNRVELPKNFNRLIELIKTEKNFKQIVSALKDVDFRKISN